MKEHMVCDRGISRLCEEFPSCHRSPELCAGAFNIIQSENWGTPPQHSRSPLCNINFLLGLSFIHVFLFLGPQLGLWEISVKRPGHSLSRGSSLFYEGN